MQIHIMSLLDFRKKENERNGRGLVWFGVIVFNATFYNFSVISWQSILLVEETEVPRENHRPSASN